MSAPPRAQEVDESFPCPAGCGEWLLLAHSTYAAKVAVGAFFEKGEAVAVRLGRCPCGATVCTRCKSTVKAADARTHMCKEATTETDAATQARNERVIHMSRSCGTECVCPRSRRHAWRGSASRAPRAVTSSRSRRDATS